MVAMQENWLPIVGYEGLYEVSDLGRVRSLDRIVERKDGRQQRVPATVLRNRTER
jgi:NUMOD4 motif